MSSNSLSKTIALLIAIACTWNTADAQTITLRMNHWSPAVTAGAQVDQWWADEVDRRTEGRVKVKIFWSEALGKTKEMLTMVKQGAIDIAAVSPSFFPAELPFFAAPNSLPMAIDSAEQAQRIAHALFEQIPAYMEEAKANNVRPMYFHVLNPYYLVCTSPIRTLEDLKGKKMRTWGEDMPRLARTVGAVPVTLTSAEFYESLQRGVVDCIPQSLDLSVSFKLHEVAKYVTKVVVYQGSSWSLWVNLDKWNSISARDQKIMLEVAEDAKKRELEKLADADRAAAETMLARGVSFIDMPVSEISKWRSSNPDFLAGWVAKMEGLGKGEAARDAAALWKKIRGG